MKFPNTKGSNLLRQQLDLPNDFQGELNILLIAFWQWQQSQVDTWVPFVQQLEKVLPSIRYYELPTIQRRNILSQTFINEGMRAGIPNPLSRERTITLYVDISSFLRSLEIDSQDNICIFVSDRQGNISWRAQGTISTEKADSLVSLLKSNVIEQTLSVF